MAHVFRFYIPPEMIGTAEIALPPEEAHHAIHVVHVKRGDAVVLFDGQGREIEGTISEVGRRKVTVARVAEKRIPKPRAQVAILQGWLLREKCIEFLIQRGTELGVAHFCFFRAGHSEKASRWNAKWLRMAVEVCKQCERSWLPTFAVAPDLEAAVRPTQGAVLIATAHTTPTPLRQALSQENVAILVGPEGDFTPEELSRAQALGAVPISLGPTTYRSEVAATLAAALVLYELGELGPRFVPSW
jgi:16S rRNA (uracil1498-N3)-methyltransferase